MNKQILSANILIVDDQFVNVKLLEKVLKQAGFENIFSTDDSRQAVPLYLEHDIDVLLLDIRMPHLDGFEVMQKLQATIQNDYLPILVLTAELTSETRSRSLTSGAKDFLTKPFDRQEVILRTSNIIEVRLLHKQILQQNIILEAEVKKRTQELENSRLEIIQRLGLAAEYKDNETGNHVLRMSKFSHALAKLYGLADKDLEMILCASPMHDIGKIGIPDRVLLKPGKLDNDEWEIMKSHVTIGAELLSGGESPLLSMAKSIALTHHEKWDGSGYPEGLSGDDIPIEGRICAISDVFDALTSERPYKEAWSIEKAVALIKDESGKHFDPRLVELFEEILPEIKSIMAEHTDD
ncbi:MAG: HD domain-containing phosphohydrolase [Methylophagaceae bacterium]